MKSMIMLLTLSSLLFATIGPPTFSPMYTIECDVYIGLPHPENYRGNTRMYIGEGVDSATGNYIDFFAGDAGVYPFAIKATLVERAMELSYLDYFFLDSPTAPDPSIGLWQRASDLSYTVYAHFIDTIMVDGPATPIEMCSPYRFEMRERFYSLPAVGDSLDFDEIMEVECRHLTPRYWRGWLIITDIVQTREPTPNPTRTTLSVVRKAHPAREQVQPISLLGRELRVLSPGVFVSPHTPVLRIPRGQ